MNKLILQKNTRSWISLTGYFGALFGLFLLSDCALAAETIGDVATHVTTSFEGLKKLIVAAAYVAGIGFGLIGVMKFKAHKDNPTQVPLSQPIVLVLIAASLVFLPALLDTAGETVFKGGTKGSVTGAGFE